MGCTGCHSTCRQCGLLLPLLVLAQLAAAATTTPKAAEVDERLIGTRPVAAASLPCLASSSSTAVYVLLPVRLAGGNVCEGAAADRHSRRPVGHAHHLMGSPHLPLQVGKHGDAGRHSLQSSRQTSCVCHCLSCAGTSSQRRNVITWSR